MKLHQMLRRSALASFASLLLLSAASQAAPITMSPEPVTLAGIRGTFTISLLNGNSSTNVLDFGVVGSNPPGWLPAAGVAALVFNGTTILSASELSDPDGLITGLSIPGTGTAMGVLIDFGAPSEASFRLRLSSTPTTATIYSLGANSVSSLYRSAWQWQKLVLSKHYVWFETGPGGGAAIPEPSAALCFAAGLVLVGSRLRRA